MKVYHYHPETKEYLGESDAKIDPMATKRVGKDTFILPAYSTFEPIPESIKGTSFIFDNNKWMIFDDHRGETYYDKTDGHVVEIKILGEEKNESLTLIPKPSELHKWDDNKWIIDEELKRISDEENNRIEKEILISEKMREMAIAELQKEGKLDISKNLPK